MTQLTQAQFDLIVEYANGYMYADRCNPEVGPGMGVEWCVELAIDSYINTAKIFHPNTITIISATDKAKIITVVRAYCKQHNL